VDRRAELGEFPRPARRLAHDRGLSRPKAYLRAASGVIRAFETFFVHPRTDMK
jgi:hypothetical protein